MPKVKGFRLSDDILLKIEKLKELYRVRGDSQLMEMIINDIYELKHSKSLVPFEELKKTDKELKMALLKLGELQGSLKEQEKVLSEKERLIQEKEKRIQEFEEQLKEKTDKKKGFWARLFGL